MLFRYSKTSKIKPNESLLINMHGKFIDARYEIHRCLNVGNFKLSYNKTGFLLESVQSNIYFHLDEYNELDMTFRGKYIVKNPNDYGSFRLSFWYFDKVLHYS